MTMERDSDEDILICLKRWVCRGYSIEEDDPLGRDEHKSLGPARSHRSRPLSADEIATATVASVFSPQELDGL